MLHIVKTFLVFLLLTSCATDITPRLIDATNLASSASLKQQLIKTDSFTLTAYKKITDKTKPLNIYIEGDGFAWATRDRLSSNPTPRKNDAVALHLATQDNAPNIVYLARPCQYTDFALNNVACEPKFWSGSRFSKTVVNSMDQAIESIVKESGVSDINLIGYSGGAAIAVLVAARRDDVASLRTVAGNLDHVAVNKHHRVSQLTDSLNPISYAKDISNLPQYHFSGVKDRVVPVFIAERFAKHVAGKHKCVKVSSVNGASHHSGWVENWQYLLDQPVSCRTKG